MLLLIVNYTYKETLIDSYTTVSIIIKEFYILNKEVLK